MTECSRIYETDYTEDTRKILYKNKRKILSIYAVGNPVKLFIRFS